MAEWATLIAALLGGSGLSAILASFAPLRRSHRLRNRLEEIDAASKLVKAETAEARALEVARTKIALEIAATALDRGPNNRLAVAWTFLCAMGYAIFTLVRSIVGGPPPKIGFADNQSVIWGMAAFDLAFFGFTATLIIRSVARQRARFILMLADRPWKERRVLGSSLVRPTLSFREHFSRKNLSDVEKALMTEPKRRGRGPAEEDLDGAEMAENPS